MWTDENRERYERRHLRYPSDLTDSEWVLIEPLIPPARDGGRKRSISMREVTNGIMYVLSTGCPWRYLPTDLPAKSTVFYYFDLWNRDGTLDAVHCELYGQCRQAAERSAGPTAAIIDSQSVKSAEKGGASIDPHGYDAGKKISGKKRHIVVDTLGLLIHAVVHPANIQDRDGGIWLLSTLAGSFQFLRTLFADGAYQGPLFSRALETHFPRLKTQIVKRSDQAKGFAVLPKRWIVERTIAWLNRCRRLAKDFENLNRNALAFLRLASIRVMVRTLCIS